MTFFRQYVSPETHSNSSIALWLVILTLMAYPLFGTMVAYTHYPSIFVSAPIRLLAIVFSLLLVVRYGAKCTTLPSFWFVVFIWLFYSIRLLAEYYGGNSEKAEEFGFKFVFFCIPVGLAFFGRIEIDDLRLARIVIITGALTSAFAIFSVNTTLLGERSLIEEAEGRLFLETVNPITYGHVGVTTLLAVIRYWGETARYSTRLLLLGVVGLACSTLYFAASRGPIVALLMAVIALGVFNKKYRILMWLSIVFGIIGYYIVQTFSQDESNYFSLRLINTFDSSLDLELRALIMQEAWKQIVDFPLLGSSIVVMAYDDYPHNPFLEIQMSVGLIGLILFALVNVIAVRNMLKRLASSSYLMALIAIQVLVGAQVSGALSQSVSMWLVLAWFSGQTFRHRLKSKPMAGAVRQG